THRHSSKTSLLCPWRHGAWRSKAVYARPSIERVKMELAFPWPYTEGEWLAWTSALVTVVLGLVAMLAPRLRLREIGQHPEALAESRGQLGGFYVGIGVAAILFAQPFVYMALGFGWTVA